MAAGGDDDIDRSFSPIPLPCGRVVRNRFVKVALYEHAASLFGGPPNALHTGMYSKWGQGAWGMVMTGNIQVAADHLSLGRDVIIPPTMTPEALAPFRQVADAIHGDGGGIDEAKSSRSTSLAIAQLSHSGRQSPNVLGGRFPFFHPLSPSATRVKGRSGDNVLTMATYYMLFQQAREMSMDDIDDVVAKFVHAAKVMKESGFDGVELHAAHGYLLAQFLSPTTNHRQDSYSEPLLLLLRIVQEIRAVTPPDFVIGIKFNCADYVAGGLTEEQALSHVRDVATWGIDFIEVSGGTYDNFEFMQRQANPSKRQVFFEHFSQQAVTAVTERSPHRDAPSRSPPLILLTGGLWMPSQFSSVLQQKHAHLLGIGRRAILFPDLPLILSQRRTQTSADTEGSYDTETYLAMRYREFMDIQVDPSPTLPRWIPRIVGAGAEEAWYTLAMHRMARGQPLPFDIGAVSAVLRMHLCPL